MQKRLTLAIVGVALAAIALVGLGVLALAQIGARQDAEAEVLDQLEALASIFESGSDPARIDANIRSLRTAFDVGRLEVVLVGADGAVRPAQRPPRSTAPILELDAAAVGLIERGDQVIVNRPSGVVGLRPITLTDPPLSGRNQRVALLVEQDVATIGRQARVWFLLSGAVVLAASVLVARWLSGRFTRPLREIEAATGQIAAGDLETRVSVDGDDELGQLGHAVNRMAADLSRSRAAEQEFLLSVSHDLRTPLTSIAGYAEALQDEAIPDAQAAGRVIGSNATRLNRLVDDLLDLARLSSSQFQLDLRPVAVDDVVAETVAGHQPMATTAEVELTLAVSPTKAPDRTVLGDADRLAQAIGNLIDNALKFADREVAVATIWSEDRVEISVRDDGPGIPVEDLEYVFERLYVTKLKPRRAENSSGLGLAIVRQLIEEMGGTARAEAGAEGGTVIVLSLPSGAAHVP